MLQFQDIVFNRPTEDGADFQYLKSSKYPTNVNENMFEVGEDASSEEVSAVSKYRSIIKDPSQCNYTYTEAIQQNSELEIDEVPRHLLHTCVTHQDSTQ